MKIVFWTCLFWHSQKGLLVSQFYSVETYPVATLKNFSYQPKFFEISFEFFFRILKIFHFEFWNSEIKNFWPPDFWRWSVDTRFLTMKRGHQIFDDEAWTPDFWRWSVDTRFLTFFFFFWHQIFDDEILTIFFFFKTPREIERKSKKNKKSVFTKILPSSKIWCRKQKKKMSKIWCPRFIVKNLVSALHRQKSGVRASSSKIWWSKIFDFGISKFKFKIKMKNFRNAKKKFVKFLVFQNRFLIGRFVGYIEIDSGHFFGTAFYSTILEPHFKRNSLENFGKKKISNHFLLATFTIVTWGEAKRKHPLSDWEYPQDVNKEV